MAATRSASSARVSGSADSTERVASIRASNSVRVIL